MSKSRIETVAENNTIRTSHRFNNIVGIVYILYTHPANNVLTPSCIQVVLPSAVLNHDALTTLHYQFSYAPNPTAISKCKTPLELISAFSSNKGSISLATVENARAKGLLSFKLTTPYSANECAGKSESIDNDSMSSIAERIAAAEEAEIIAQGEISDAEIVSKVLTTKVKKIKV